MGEISEVEAALWQLARRAVTRGTMPVRVAATMSLVTARVDVAFCADLADQDGDEPEPGACPG